MQCLSEVHVQNFRSCADVRIPLGDLTVLVGRNNSGKSTIMRAVQWLLRRSSLVEAEFGDPAAPVVLSGVVAGLDDSVLARLEATHRQKIEPYCHTGQLEIRRTQPRPGAASKDMSFEVRAPGDGDEWGRNPAGIDQAIAALFPEPIVIEAMQDVPEDVAKVKTGSTIGRLLAPLTESICTAHGEDLANAFAAFNSRLGATGDNRAAEAVDFDSQANDALRDFFPGLVLLLDVTMPEVRDLFKAATIRVVEDGDDAVRSLADLGHGAQRAIQMALIKRLASAGVGGGDSRRTLLLIEEPELYLHPQAAELVRRALHDLSRQAYQVVYSTHSPLMVHRDHVADAVVVQKLEPRRTSVRRSLRHSVEQAVLDGPSQAETLFEFGRASEVLFSDRVLLAEGATERRLLSPVFEAVRRETPVAARLGIVTIGGSGGIAKTLEILRAMGLDGRALADLDYAFATAMRAGLLAGDDADVASCLRALGTLEAAGKCKLDLSSGRPVNHVDGTAAEAYALLAALPVAEQPIEGLCEKLRNRGVWLWPRGTIEAHLGLQGKSEAIHSAYERRLREEDPRTVIADYDGVERFLEWLVG